MEKIRVVLVDDQALLRSGFAMLINSQEDLKVVGEAETGAEALELLKKIPADVVLMDIRMPVMNGIECCSELLSHPEKYQSPHLKVVMLTTFDLDEYSLAAIQAGASGFLLKDAPPEDLLEAVRTVYSGDAVIAPSTTKRLLEHVSPLLDKNQDRIAQKQYVEEILSPREMQVFTGISQGKSNTELAEEFFLSEATIKTHVGHILNKLGVRDRVQAAVLAYELGVAKPGDASDL
ncbi:MAG: response regulator transcription factor [Micrococcaceae bacterium]